METRTMKCVGSGASALLGLFNELAAADDLITELVAENEELRSRLAGMERAANVTHV